jgi:hypothetical protein
MTAQTAVMTSEMTKVVRSTCASSPIRSMLAAAFWSLAGEITLASPAPIPLAAAIRIPAEPIFSAVMGCRKAGGFAMLVSVLSLGGPYS